MPYPKYCENITRKARKIHKCCGCGNMILPGDMYNLTNGVWDDGWGHYKQCKSCMDLYWFLTNEWDVDHEDISMENIIGEWIWEIDSDITVEILYKHLETSGIRNCHHMICVYEQALKYLEISEEEY